MTAITQFFSNIGFPLKNKRWSWGGENKNGNIVLRTWEPDTSKHGKSVRVLQYSDRLLIVGDRNKGLMERIEHLDRIRRTGAGAYTIISNVMFSKTGEPQSSGFREDVIFPIEMLAADDSGDVWARLSSPIPVDELTDHSRHWKTEDGISSEELLVKGTLAT